MPKSQTKQIPVASALIRKAGGTLLLRRSRRNRHFAGYWQLPEGKVEAGESRDNTLKRELAEELGCSPTSFEELGVTLTTKTIEGIIITVERTVFKAAIEGDIQLSEEHDDYAWMTPTALKRTTLLYPGTQDLLTRFGDEQ